MEYITYDAGCGIWVVEPFNPKIEWHKSEYTGTKKECEREAKWNMDNQPSPHYPDAEYGSIFDY